VNGISGGNSVVSTIVVTGLASASYTAPAILPTTNPVTIHATEGGSILAATITIVSNVTVSVLPVTASIATGQRVTLTPTAANCSDTSVTSSANGIANGNATVGQIYQEASSPCVAPAGAGAGSVDYLASDCAHSKSGGGDCDQRGRCQQERERVDYDFRRARIGGGKHLAGVCVRASIWRSGFDATIFYDGHWDDEHECDLERAKRRGGPGLLRHGLRIDQFCWALHCANGRTFAERGDGNRDEPGQ
jgi:hypothetical protein